VIKRDVFQTFFYAKAGAFEAFQAYFFLKNNHFSSLICAKTFAITLKINTSNNNTIQNRLNEFQW